MMYYIFVVRSVVIRFAVGVGCGLHLMLLPVSDRWLVQHTDGPCPTVKLSTGYSAVLFVYQVGLVLIKNF